MRHTYLAAAAGALALAGCSTLGISDPRYQAPPGAELVGQRLLVESARGQASTMTFAGDGIVRAAFGTQQATGRWQVLDDQLCFYWGQAPRECWPYAAPFVRGRTVALTSDRGNAVRVTLQ